MANENPTKICKKCNRELPADSSHFPAYRVRHVSGLRSRCYDCQKEYFRKYNLAHKGSVPAEYGAWITMRQRCNNPKAYGYPYYGGRGIKVCKRWRSFDRFLTDMGPRPTPLHSLDRRDNDGNYEPSNCRWATRAEQNRNRRDNKQIEYQGETLVPVDAADRAGINRSTFWYRIERGVTGDALFAPANQHYNHHRK